MAFRFQLALVGFLFFSAPDSMAWGCFSDIFDRGRRAVDTDLSFRGEEKKVPERPISLTKLFKFLRRNWDGADTFIVRNIAYFNYYELRLLYLNSEELGLSSETVSEVIRIFPDLPKQPVGKINLHYFYGGGYDLLQNADRPEVLFLHGWLMINDGNDNIQGFHFERGIYYHYFTLHGRNGKVSSGFISQNFFMQHAAEVLSADSKFFLRPDGFSGSYRNGLLFRLLDKWMP